MGPVEAYLKLNAKLESNYDWSSISKDNSYVVLSMWQDQFIKPIGKKPLTYSCYVDDVQNKSTQWMSNPRNFKKISHILYAINQFNSLCRAVIIKAVDVNANERKVKAAFPTNHIYRIVSLDIKTGEFKAEFVEVSPLP